MKMTRCGSSSACRAIGQMAPACRCSGDCQVYRRYPRAREVSMASLSPLTCSRKRSARVTSQTRCLQSSLLSSIRKARTCCITSKSWSMNIHHASSCNKTNIIALSSLTQEVSSSKRRNKTIQSTSGAASIKSSRCNNSHRPQPRTQSPNVSKWRIRSLRRSKRPKQPARSSRSP